MSCNCPTASEPVDLATFNATMTTISETLASILALMVGKLGVPSVSEGAATHLAYVAVWVQAVKDTEVRVEVRPVNNTTGSDTNTSLSISMASTESGGGAVYVAKERNSIPTGKSGINYALSVVAKIPAGYWFNVGATNDGDGLDDDYTRVVITEI